jgi:hypothetical protein
MPDADAVLDELRRFTERPPRDPLAVAEVAERAGRRHRRALAIRAAGGVVAVLLLAGAVAAWAGAGDDDAARTVRAGPGAPAPTSSAQPAPPDPAVWVTDLTAVPQPTASSFTAMASRLGCNDGATGRILPPEVTVTATEVVVRFTAEGLGQGAHRCPGGDWVPYVVDVGEPIGDRALVDGACRGGGQAPGTAYCAEDAGRGVRWRPRSGPITTPLFRILDRSSERAHRSSLASGVLPDMRGVDLNELGDGTGVLYDLWDRIGRQRTVEVADDAPEGSVIAQDPPPGTPLDLVHGWTLTVSGGGPVVRFDDLPGDVAAFALTLPGFRRDEPLTMRTTGAGPVYKTDRWLFGLDCAAVDLAYRTFFDARYDTACPGHIENPGS